jgi:threonine dehydratase
VDVRQALASIHSCTEGSDPGIEKSVDQYIAGTVPNTEVLRQARARISPELKRTPVLSSRTINRLCGGEVFFKCENMQRVGAFKARGALNAVLSLSEKEALRGVVTHSSGNHGAALAYAASLRDITATIVVPNTASQTKVENVKRYGGQVEFCEPTLEDREKVSNQLLESTGGVLIHPFDDFRVVAGQATAAMEFIEEVEGLELLVTPIGGGGLISGTCLAAKYFGRGIAVHGVEPEGADEAARSFQAGRLTTFESNPVTIADGLLAHVSELTFGVIRDHVEGIAAVSDAETIHAMRLVWMVLKIVIEPSAAVAVAALLEGRIDVRNKRVGLIISGGNVDPDHLPWTESQSGNYPKT